jgi:hypothetical protein
VLCSCHCSFYSSFFQKTWSMLCSLLTSSFLELLLSRKSKFSQNTFADMCTYELMTAFVPLLCSATLLPSIKRFLPKEWNDNLIVWRAPLIHCMTLTHFDARSCLSNYADLEINCIYVCNDIPQLYLIISSMLL